MSTSDNLTSEDLGAPAMNSAAPQFEPDDITDFDFADRPSEVVSLIGYLGKGGSGAFRRLYLNASLRQWLAIPENAIADTYSLGGKDAPTEGKTVVWVYRNQSVVRCEAVPVSIFETLPQTDTASGGEPQPQVVLSPSQVAAGPDEEDDWSWGWPRKPRRPRG
jgi:hypothetical protein